jgi:hypothetical protein
MIVNRMLNETFPIRNDEQNAALWEMIGESENTNKALDGEAWKQTLAAIAFGGIPETADKALDKLAHLEKLVRETRKIPSERPGGKRSMGTGYALDPLFKSYKSTIRGAILNGVELLDAVGMPKSRPEVTEAVKQAKVVEKTDEEKLGSLTDSWLAVYAKCADGHPLTVDAVNKLINALSGRGALPETMAEAA